MNAFTAPAHSFCRSAMRPTWNDATASAASSTSARNSRSASSCIPALYNALASSRRSRGLAFRGSVGVVLFRPTGRRKDAFTNPYSAFPTSNSPRPESRINPLMSRCPSMIGSSASCSGESGSRFIIRRGRSRLNTTSKLGIFFSMSDHSSTLRAPSSSSDCGSTETRSAPSSGSTPGSKLKVPLVHVNSV